MDALRIFAVSLNQTPLDFGGNVENVRKGLREARACGAQLVCLPELCLCGYGCEDAFLWPKTAEQSQGALAQVLDESRGMIVALGLPLWCEGELYNASVLVADGRVVGAACKKNLAKSGIHYEPRWFRPWRPGRVETVKLLGQEVPVGDLIFEINGVRIAFEICEDAWVEDRPAHQFASCNIDVILNPSASHFAFAKHAYRRKLVLDGARATRAGYVYCNLLGNEAGRAIYDGDCLVARGGNEPAIVAESHRFSFRDFQLAGATLPLAQREKATSQVGSMQLVSTRIALSEATDHSVVSSKTPGEDIAGVLEKEQAFGRAVALGLADYLRKSRSRGFVVSLSGGADSATVCLMVRLMVRLCFQECGAEETCARLAPHLAGTVLSERELMTQLLTTVYQATRHSSETTRAAAAGLAHDFFTNHHEVSVDEFVEGYRTKVEQMLKRPLSWERDDVALQNIQARARAPLVWMLANTQGALLLSTSNRSEAAVGYATMDGDTAGGLSPLAGIDKSFIRRWLIFMQHVGIVELGPVPALQRINEQQPTAELRPAEYEQTDEGDLMPYDVLDFVERQSIYRRRAPGEVLEALVERFACDREQALAWMRRFYHLFAINQWKRERYAPSFFVDEGNLDPKTWFRYPILSGGFSTALDELQRGEEQEPKD